MTEDKHDENLPAVYEVPNEPCLYDEHPTQAYLWARDAWWRGRESATSIANIIGIPRHKLNTWIHGTKTKDGWKKEKARVTQYQFRRFQEDEREKLERLLQKILKLLGTSMERFLDDNITLTVSEFNAVSSAFEKLFKMRQLMMGQATEILGVGDNKDITWDNLVKKIQEVDILDYEKVNEISNAKSESVGRRET